MSEILNPFADELSLANSNCAVYRAGKLVHPESNKPASKLSQLVHDELRALILNDHFSCLGGKSALRRNAYRFGLYGELGSPAATAGLARDLFAFVADLPQVDSEFATFLASFHGPIVGDELSFERLLWRTLQPLHDLDFRYHPWDPTVSDDPADPHFSFSFGGTAFFVLGLHAASSRVARRFAWPTLVFNPHRQFVALRDSGRFERFKSLIRGAEQALQGDVNPMLADYGALSEAPQYSGRQVDASWRCPFVARHRSGEQSLGDERKSEPM